MRNVQLSLEQAEVIQELLQHRLAEMDLEIFRTDTHDYKQMLKHRRELLEQVLKELEFAPVTV
jgi:porphobilinogen deaminase